MRTFELVDGKPAVYLRFSTRHFRQSLDRDTDEPATDKVRCGSQAAAISAPDGSAPPCLRAQVQREKISHHWVLQYNDSPKKLFNWVAVEMRMDSSRDVPRTPLLELLRQARMERRKRKNLRGRARRDSQPQPRMRPSHSAAAYAAAHAQQRNQGAKEGQKQSDEQ